MSITIDVTYSGGFKIAADFGDHVVQTDQPVKDGGEDSAPTPFSLFLASLATCAGTYAYKFCEKRDIDTDGLSFRLVCEQNEKTSHFDKMTFEITTPEGFPEKYVKPLKRAVDHCYVKKHVIEPPEFAIEVK